MGEKKNHSVIILTDIAIRFMLSGKDHFCITLFIFIHCMNTENFQGNLLQ